MSDFNSQNSIPFAFGSLTGIRCWRVHRDGRLQAVNHTYLYYPGENKAHCAMGIPLTTVQLGYPGEKSYKRVEHFPGVHWCSCGFYGYYAGTDYTINQYAGTDTITGLVQAYGRCSYGRNGFRAEKLKILAIVNPFLTDIEIEQQALLDQSQNHTGEVVQIPWRRRLKAWYYRGWKPFVLPLLFAVWFILSSAYLGYRETDLGKVLQSFSGIISFGIAIWLFHKTLRRKTATALQRLMHQTEHIEETPECLLPGNTRLTRRDYDRVRTMYPDVPHYPSVEEALKIFPLTNYHKDTPGGRRRIS